MKNCRLDHIIIDLINTKWGEILCGFDEKSSLEAYLIDRKSSTEAELRLYLRETNFCCPLCGKELQSRKQKKGSQKMFEIAHIFPNSPTEEQIKVLGSLERLGTNCEAFENKIALCKDCHSTQDFHTTEKEYIHLLNKKKKFLNETALRDATDNLGLEKEISEIIEKICNLDNDLDAEIKYSAIPISNKFEKNEFLLKNKVQNNVNTYYTFISELFSNMEGSNGFKFEVLSLQIRSCFLKMEAINNDKTLIFQKMTEWIKNKTLSNSTEASEIVISFFIQNCEVFNEITK